MESEVKKEAPDASLVCYYATKDGDAKINVGLWRKVKDGKAYFFGKNDKAIPVGCRCYLFENIKEK